MTRTAVLNVVGLTAELIDRAAPRIARWASGGAVRSLHSAFPAVTCTAQSTDLTGRYPETHGIVANGWYARDEGEVRFWRQSNRLVQAPKIWEQARAANPSFTCANLFWWFNMYSSVDVGVTPRPMYPADGRKLPDVYTTPPDLRHDLQRRLGTFPLFNFWGPRASIASTRWIADAARHVEERYTPSLSLVYLPHLDYNLQRVGPGSHAALVDVDQVDAVVAELIEFFERRNVQVLLLSEYGLRDVSRPVHLNRVLRERGLIAVREELGRELLDPPQCRAFAVADHQIAHVYVADPARIGEVRALIEGLPGVERVLDEEGKRAVGLDHPRSGELVAVARADSWFTYYYWLDDARCPDFARTVEIHRKPGYDPVELFLDPAIRVPKLAIGWRLGKRALGFRTLLDVIPLDATLVKGSHGRPTDDPAHGPVFITSDPDLSPKAPVAATEVKRLMLDHVFGGR